jgi:hypothetical protein
MPADDAPGERDVFTIAADGSRETLITSHRKNDELVGCVGLRPSRRPGTP